MAYNKAKAEREWLRWKEAEEKKLRELGVDEDTIQRLRTYDWEGFKRERRRQEWIDKGMPGLAPVYSSSCAEVPVTSVESLLDCIENPELFDILKSTDKQTLEILLMKICGYNSCEISQRVGISTKAVDLRMVRLRKKLKNIFVKRRF